MEARLRVFFVWFFGSLLKHGSASNIRLIGDSTRSSPSGILQILHNGKWGTICSDGWDIADTNVACKQLGHSSGVKFMSMGEGSGQIWLVNVGCTGSEGSLNNCSHPDWGVHDCNHAKDVGIVCQSGSPDVSVRLVNGKISRFGGVEVRYYGIWRSICDTNWDRQDANVVCRMLGYRQGAAFGIQGYQSSGLVWLSDVRCSGHESSIENCNNPKWGKEAESCPNNRRAGVFCISGSSNVRFRLSERNKPNLHVGRLQVSYYSTVGSICAENCDLQDAHAVCRTAGYSQALAVYNKESGMFRFTPVMHCSGRESSIQACRHYFNGINLCASKTDAWIVCKLSGSWTTTIRLQGGSSSMEGRVEIQQYGVWGTVCNSYWDIRDANVVCRMLNYKGAMRVYTRGGGTGPIWLTGLGCKGDEKDILNCIHSGLGQTRSCNHGNDAGVVCHRYPGVVQVRLAGGPSPYVGRVEVKFNNIWGTICLGNWDINDAHVVCRMLNYNRALAAIRRFGGGSGKVWLHNVGCTGKEKSIDMCYHAGWNGWGTCDHSLDAGVICLGNDDQNPNVAVRLVPGYTPNQGRVEVRYYGVWGAICHHSWGLADAYVVCHMLNYSKASWAGDSKYKGSRGRSGPILLDNVRCSGNEASIEHCAHNGLGRESCTHGEDAGLVCENLPKEEQFVEARLTGPVPFFGTVEVKYKWTWMSVCDDTWDILDAHVVCRMLGYQAALAGIKRYKYGHIKGSVLGGVNCNGMEATISECYHRGWTNNECNPRFRSAVLCQHLNSSLPIDIRLEDGNTPNSGRVAVRYGNVWGTICNRGLDINDTKVICRMLGYPGTSKVYSKFIFRPGNGTIWLSNLECNGTEDSIVDCRHPGWGQTICSHDNDARVDCQLASVPKFHLNALQLTESTALLMIEKSSPMEKVLDSAYQIICEKIVNKDVFSSADQTKKRLPYYVHGVTMATSNGSSMYVTAEVTYYHGSFNFTVGDGLLYSGYHNVPLEAGCAYKVHMRIVTKDCNGRKVYGDSSFVAFTTKPGGKGNKFFQVSNGVVIALSIALVVLIAIILGHLVRRRLRKKNGRLGKSTKKGNDQGEELEMTSDQTYYDNTTRQYQSLHYGEPQAEQEEVFYVNLGGANQRQFERPSTVVTPNVYTMESSLYENVQH